MPATDTLPGVLPLLLSCAPLSKVCSSSPPTSCHPPIHPQIIKFTGCYHGHADQFLVQAGSGVLTLGLSDSPGVPATTAAATLTAKYNDLESVKALFEANKVRQGRGRGGWASDEGRRGKRRLQARLYVGPAAAGVGRAYLLWAAQHGAHPCLVLT